MPKTFFDAWSASRFATYQQCPLKAKLQFLDKVPEPKSRAMERGGDLHMEVEHYITGETDEFPASFSRFQEDVEDLRLRYRNDPDNIAIEEQWGFAKTWGRADWFDWANCWARVKVDVIYLEGGEVVITDWKTGKFRDTDVSKYLEQLDLYALAGLLVFGDRATDITVKPRLIYVDVGKVYDGPTSLNYTLKDVPRLKQEWNRRVRPMMNDRTFAPKPNKYCYNCHFRKANAANGGGQCPY